MLLLPRDPEIWRLACLKVWGRSCIKLVPYTSWREMFLERPRVRFDGKLNSLEPRRNSDQSVMLKLINSLDFL